jgi:hypothetical protein
LPVYGFDTLLHITQSNTSAWIVAKIYVEAYAVVADFEFYTTRRTRQMN